jgi:hypothetical protein
MSSKKVLVTQFSSEINEEHKGFSSINCEEMEFEKEDKAPKTS